LLLAGEISPKFIVTDKLFSTLELPLTDPPNAPVMVGRPPLLISKFCAEIVGTTHAMNMARKIT
jgi:hypothetical protein